MTGFRLTLEEYHSFLKRFPFGERSLVYEEGNLEFEISYLPADAGANLPPEAESGISGMEERRKVNYDHPKAFDWPLMRKQIADLKAGKAIQKPTYDFTILTRSGKTERIEPKEVIIAEGIMYEFCFPS